ncbi:MAG: hypothetical protein PUB22_02650, partial [Clostridiales bacterium]|nr:hypothetical protein [Clostridiales bacterium]
MKRSYGWRWLIYLLGLLILALGITLNTKTGFGVSPIISVAFSVSCIWNQKLGDMTFALYVLYDVIEMAVHVGIWMRSRRCGKPYSLKSMICFDILQIPLGLVFSRFINVYSAILPDFTIDFQGQFLG